MKPVETSDSERAYGELVELLVSGEISEDQALSERGLAEKLNLGRTPIREAIKTLVREGVFESHATRGTVLKPMSLGDLQDLYEIRFAIEGLAAFLAAERGPVDNLRPYIQSFKKTLGDRSACNVDKVHGHGIDFHFEVIRIAGNRRLIEMYRPFRLKFRIPFAIAGKSNPERVLASAAEHLEIANAIAARKADLARTLICEHLKRGLDYRTGMLLKRSNYVAPQAGSEGKKKTRPAPRNARSN